MPRFFDFTTKTWALMAKKRHSQAGKGLFDDGDDEVGFNVRYASLEKATEAAVKIFQGREVCYEWGDGSRQRIGGRGRGSV